MNYFSIFIFHVIRKSRDNIFLVSLSKQLNHYTRDFSRLQYLPHTPSPYIQKLTKLPSLSLAGISRKSRSLFLELDATAAKTGRPVTPSNGQPRAPVEAPRRARDVSTHSHCFLRVAVNKKEKKTVAAVADYAYSRRPHVARETVLTQGRVCMYMRAVRLRKTTRVVYTQSETWR